MIFIRTTYEKELRKLNKQFPNEILREKSSEYILKLAKLDFKYNKIDEYEYEKRCINSISQEWTIEKKEEELLKIELKYNKIDSLEYEKQLHDIHKKPWAKIHFNYDEDIDPSNLQTEIVYNEWFIKKLQKMGYSGENETDIIESWLSQVFASNVDVGDIVHGDPIEQKYITKQKLNNTYVIG